MKTIEEGINQLVEEHAECRWLDASELKQLLEQVATEQKALDDRECETMVGAAAKEVKQVMIDKACEWIVNIYLGDYVTDEFGNGGIGNNVKLAEDFRNAMER